MIMIYFHRYNFKPLKFSLLEYTKYHSNVTGRCLIIREMQYNIEPFYLPLISSLIEYLGLLDVFTGNMFLIQVTFGGGSPAASHIRWAVWSTSTAFATGDLVILGKPGGSLSAKKEKKW